MVAFISGHRDATREEFEEHYIPMIDTAISCGYSFVVGNYPGIDYMAQEYLLERCKDRVRVFHMYTDPTGVILGLQTTGGFLTDEDRDTAMMLLSDYDIAWVRDGRSDSGTAQNIRRRIKLQSDINDML